MDFGLMGMEGLMGHHHQHPETGSPDPDGKRNCCSGSGHVMQEISGSGSVSGSPEEEDPSRAPKVAGNGHPLGLSMAMAHQQPEMLNLMRSNPPQSQMLSFASPTSQVSFLSTSKADKPSLSFPVSYYQHPHASLHSRNSGYASGSMQGSFTGIRGPFTPAQWIELEHQALIYKYFNANVPVPATLLLPIQKALNPSGFSGFSGSFPAHSYGWGPFHLGYSSSTDPEPGRCRRTDGKKWRCSRDAVQDQKYCERHINRGRHRSRKPVEGQSGQAASGPTDPKVVPISSSMSSSSVVSGGSASNSLAIGSHQLKSLQASVPDPATDPVVNRLQDPHALNLKAKDSPFCIREQHILYKESSQPEFGFVSTDALLNPLPNHSVNPWSEELKSDWTQLSMSIPMSELSSSSPNQEKVAQSPLRLSHELNDAGTKHASWIPISSMGGPLGEVLNSAGSAVASCRSTSALNLMGEGWELDSSPTGVLQKAAFVSLSNSGSGSSPTDENQKTQETDELLGSAHAASSIPAL